MKRTSACDGDEPSALRERGPRNELSREIGRVELRVRAEVDDPGQARMAQVGEDAVLGLEALRAALQAVAAGRDLEGALRSILEAVASGDDPGSLSRVDDPVDEKPPHDAHARPDPGGYQGAKV